MIRLGETRPPDGADQVAVRARWPRRKKDVTVMRISSMAAGAAAVSLLAAFVVSSTTLVAIFCLFSLLCLAAWFVLERRGD